MNFELWLQRTMPTTINAPTINRTMTCVLDFFACSSFFGSIMLVLFPDLLQRRFGSVFDITVAGGIEDLRDRLFGKGCILADLTQNGYQLELQSSVLDRRLIEAGDQ